MSFLSFKRTVRKYLFARMTRVLGMRGNIMPLHGRADRVRRSVFVAVEAFNKDHALERLQEEYPFVPKLDWDFLDELDSSHDLGMLGETLKLTRH